MTMTTTAPNTRAPSPRSESQILADRQRQRANEYREIIVAKSRGDDYDRERLADLMEHLELSQEDVDADERAIKQTAMLRGQLVPDDKLAALHNVAAAA